MGEYRKYECHSDYVATTEEMKLAKFATGKGFMKLPFDGYCLSNVNSWLPKVTLPAKNGQECIQKCSEEFNCLGVTFDNKKNVCEYQCDVQDSFCTEPAFPE